jgi:hypothetical protein
LPQAKAAKNRKEKKKQDWPVELSKLREKDSNVGDRKIKKKHAALASRVFLSRHGYSRALSATSHYMRHDGS